MTRRLCRPRPALLSQFIFFTFHFALFVSFSWGNVETEPPTIPIIPSEDELRAVDEAAHEARKRAHEEDIAAGKDPAYIATFRGEGFGNDESEISVRINGVDATDVLLHNTSAFSFRVPTSLVLDRDSMRSSFVEIHVGMLKHTPIPLQILEAAISKVDLLEYREEISRVREQRLREEKEKTESSLENDDQVSGDAEDSADDAYNIEEEDGYEPAEGENDLGAEVNQEEFVVDEEFNGSKERDERTSHAEKLLLERKRASTKEAVRILEEVIAEGDPRAMTVYGTALLSGTSPGLSINLESAVTYLKAASEMGFPDAQAMLGFLYASGIAGKALRKDIGAAILMWTFAAEGGSMYAKMALGYRYFTGTDIPEDCTRASTYYKSVADEVFRESRESHDRQTGRKRESETGDDDAVVEIRPPTSSAMFASDRKYLTEGMAKRVMGEANEVVQYYRHSADRGDAMAQVTMGNLYYYGALDMPQDTSRARQLFMQAAYSGRAEAHAHLGFMDLRAGKNESAVDHLKKAALHGDKLGLHGMGFVSLHGIGVKKNPEMAADYFDKAIQKEHPEAMFNLAIMYLKGIGVTQSAQEAYRLFQMAARYGHMQSHYQVGTMLLEGRYPAEKECTTATHFLKLVAQQGIWNKILSMAFRAYERSAYADSLFRYLQAAHAGIELAQFNAAFMFEHNTISNSDGLSLKLWGLADLSSKPLYSDRGAVVEEALALYQMSASQGHRDSMVRMGDLAFGEAKDFARAAAAYERAVKLDSAEAMFNLGWMHARGFGMNADKHIAKRYFDLAKAADDDAKLPATIAIYVLKYSESLVSCVNKLATVFPDARLLDAVQQEMIRSGISFSWQWDYVDVLALIFLQAILISVVILRRVRLSARARERQVADPANAEDDLLQPRIAAGPEDRNRGEAERDIHAHQE